MRISYERDQLQYYIPGLYNPDWTVSLPSGRVFYIEGKGWFKYEDKRKMLAVLNSNPGVDIRMVFMTKNKKNIAWCEKHGVPWAIGKAPKEWFEE